MTDTAGIAEAYGVEKVIVKNLRQRWRRGLEGDNEWEDFEEFVAWALMIGCRKGEALRKIDPEKPHGPDNSYFYNGKEVARAVKEKIMRDRDIRSPFCVDCTKASCPANGNGCRAWQRRWIDNWNNRISTRQPETTPGKREMFRYWHPEEKR